MAMADIVRVEVGPRSLAATVRIAEGAPLRTSEDLEGTTRVYNLMPHIIEHVCVGDGGETFKDVMGNTELAHLLEHMTVELLAQSDRAGDVTAGRTRAIGDDGRTFEIELACADDVLVAGALSSAAWMLDWAFGGGEGAEPDVAATVEGLVGLVDSLPEVEPAPRRVATPVAPAVPDEDGGPRLRLVDDDEPVSPEDEAARTSRLDGTNVTTAVVIEEGPSPSSEVVPAESPEARQAAADVPAASADAAAATATIPAVEAPAEPGEGAVAPMPQATSPSITGSLPVAQQVR